MTGTVIAAAAVSLDGFVADDQDDVGPLFDWYNNGEVEVFGTDPGRPFHVSSASAAYMSREWAQIGAVVIGRRLFDLTDGWGGVPAVGEHVVVVSHRDEPADWRRRFPDAPFTFVTDLAQAIARAKELAGDRNVSLTAGNLAGQALAAGLVDEVSWSVVPVVFGSGVRFFGDYSGAPALLDDPEVIPGDRVTHLHFRTKD